MIYNVSCSNNGKTWKTHNVLTYACWDIVAKIMGGETGFIPNYVGFVFGTEVDPFIVDDGTKDITYPGLTGAISAYGNIQLTRISSKPAYEASDSMYSNNILNLTCATADANDYEFDNDILLDTGKYMYKALFLSKVRAVNDTTTYLLAHTDLAMANGSYAQKVAGINLGISWNMIFSDLDTTEDT